VTAQNHLILSLISREAQVVEVLDRALHLDIMEDQLETEVVIEATTTTVVEMQKREAEKEAAVAHSSVEELEEISA
jgi:hypothetical protein